MAVITDQDAPRFDLGGTHVVGLASPARGSSENSAWRLTLDAGAASPPHTLDREEIFVALGGQAVARLGDRTERVGSGDALIVPPGVEFTLEAGADAAFEAVVCMPAGGTASVDGAVAVPPWAA
jgi:quercetin dioxygenase-like cupin family protein